MSRQENIFLATRMTVAEVAKLTIDNLRLPPVGEKEIEADAAVVGLRGPALDHEGSDLLLTVKMKSSAHRTPSQRTCNRSISIGSTSRPQIARWPGVMLRGEYRAQLAAGRVRRSSTGR